MESLPSPPAVIGFPGFPFDLPLAPLGSLSGASLVFGALIAAAAEALAGDALAGTAGVFAFGFSSFFLVRRDCSMDILLLTHKSFHQTL
jgi:hypothetical protein